jgi:hypothetical protein
MRKPGEPAIIGCSKMKGTVSPATNCSNNRKPTVRPTLFADLIIGSFKGNIKGIPD